MSLAKRILSACVFATVVTVGASFVAAETRITYHENGNKRSEERYDENGQRSGESVFYHLDGKTVSNRWNYSNNLATGVATSYYADGTIQSKVTYVESQLQGEELHYYPSGRLKTKAHFDRGKLTGRFVAYYDLPDEKVAQKIDFQENVKHGKYLAYSPEQVLLRDESWENGVPNGTWKTFYDSSRIHEIWELKAGLKDGVYTRYFDHEGKLPYVEIPYANNVIEGVKKVYHTPTPEHPTLVAQLAPHEGGLLNGTVESFYANATQSMSEEYVDSVKNGATVIYYGNGRVHKKMNFKDNQLHGPYIEFFDNAEPRRKKEGAYRDGSIFGLWKEWRLNGTRVSEVNYVGGVMDGPAAFYDQYEVTQNLLEAYNYKKEQFGAVADVSEVSTAGAPEGDLSEVSETGDFPRLTTFYAKGKEHGRHVEREQVLIRNYPLPRTAEFPISEEGMMDGGKRTGTWKKWENRDVAETGLKSDLLERTQWVDGVQHGEQLLYMTNPSSQTLERYVAIRENYNMGQMVSRIQYCADDPRRIESEVETSSGQPVTRRHSC